MDDNELNIKIEVAKQQGLFNEKNINNCKVFDCYGNYFFPTDFSISEDNTIMRQQTRYRQVNYVKSSYKAYVQASEYSYNFEYIKRRYNALKKNKF